MRPRPAHLPRLGTKKSTSMASRGERPAVMGLSIWTRAPRTCPPQSQTPVTKSNRDNSRRAVMAGGFPSLDHELSVFCPTGTDHAVKGRRRDCLRDKYAHMGCQFSMLITSNLECTSGFQTLTRQRHMYVYGLPSPVSSGLYVDVCLEEETGCPNYAWPTTTYNPPKLLLMLTSR